MVSVEDRPTNLARVVVLPLPNLRSDLIVVPARDSASEADVLCFCNGPSVVNPSLALSDRRALASVRGRREAAT